MRFGLISDVHGNAPALEAVLDALESLAPDAVVCMGDLVGYNAEPAFCVSAVRAAADVVVAGNHDRGAVDPTMFRGVNQAARTAIEWTHAVLSADDRNYLAALPGRHVDPHGFIAVHGCFLNEHHITGYVTGTMLEDNLTALRARTEWPDLAFCGHTHVPMCGWLDEHGCTEPRVTQSARWSRNACAVLVNPGSVGQPRDGDPRASFAVVDVAARTVEFRRVRYDVERAVRAIREAGLPETLAVRLQKGE